MAWHPLQTSGYAEKLKRLRDLMIHSKLGYRSLATGYLKASLRDNYPIAYEAFEEELAR